MPQIEAPNSFGSWLKQVRKTLDMTQGELAASAGCALKTLAKIENGERLPSRQLAELLSKAVGVPAGHLDEFTQWARELAGPPPAVEAGAWRTWQPDNASGALARPGVATPAVATPNNLPAPPTELIGHEDLLEVGLAALRRPQTRLLTLTGPGGVGKSRIALELAGRLCADFSGGVFFVPLAPITDPELVIPTIAKTLGVSEVPGKPLVDSLKAHLDGQRILLLLDNFEQVVAAAPLVSKLLPHCLGLKLLVTSREVLRLRGEKVLAVPSLTLPGREVHTPAELLASSEAVRLFVARAQDRLYDFALNEENAPSVAEISRRLDGLPLAIELAAARTRHLSPQAILDGLEARLPFLTASLADLPARQQTLRSTIAWSYNLLSGDEHALFRRLGVFVGGFSLDDVRAICAPGDNSEDGVLALLESLFDKSLLQYASVYSERAYAEPRFQVLETIREYALEKLQASGELAQLRARHAAQFLALAERAEPELRGADQLQWLQRLEQEHDNLRAALRWSVQHTPGEHPDRAETGLRLASALARFWNIRGYLSEGREHLNAAVSVARAAGIHGEYMARALRGAGSLAILHGDMQAARSLQQESLAVSRKIGDKRGMAASLNEIGRIIFYYGDCVQARPVYEESLQVAREVGDKAITSAALGNLGIIARFQGDYALARSMFEETLAVKREMGDKRSIALVLVSLGNVSKAQGDYEAARRFYEESLPIYHEIGDRPNVAIAMVNLSKLALLLRDYSAARALTQECLALSREIGERLGEIAILATMGSLALAEGDHAAARSFHEQSLRLANETGTRQTVPENLVAIAGVILAEGKCAGGEASRAHVERAVKLVGAAEGMIESLGSILETDERGQYDEVLRTARERMGEAAATRAWEEGKSLDVEQVMALALLGDNLLRNAPPARAHR